MRDVQLIMVLVGGLSPAAGAPITFVVSPDTHFTQCGGVPDVDKNTRGIDDLNTLPGSHSTLVPYPPP